MGFKGLIQRAGKMFKIDAVKAEISRLTQALKGKTPPLLYIHVCLQFLKNTAAYVAPDKAACSLINCPPVMLFCG